MQKRNDDIIQSVGGMRRAFLRVLQQDAERVGITQMQLIILSRISKQPNINLSDLATQSMQSASTVSGIIDRLVAAGLVHREQNSKNRRAIILNLTELGKEKRTEAFSETSFVNKRMQKLEAEISEEEWQQFFTINHKVTQLLEES